MEAKILQPTISLQHKSKEGLLKSKGKKIYDDSWLHEDMLDDKKDEKAEKSIQLYIDLEKGMHELHKEHLVIRQVQVHGQNGKVFTRKQWVDPHTGLPVGQKPAQQVQQPVKTQKQHIDDHISKLSKEDKYKLMQQHNIQYNKHENSNKDHMNAMMALKNHLYKNPHLVGAEHLPKDELRLTPDGVDHVNAFVNGNQDKLYQLMREFNLGDGIDPRTVPEWGKSGNNTAPIKHMHNMMKLKVYLKDNPHIMEGSDHSAAPIPPSKKIESTQSASPSQPKTIDDVLKRMSSEELYDIMRGHGIADIDPRTVKELGKDGNNTAPIKHMHNMMKLKKLMQEQPHMFNLGENAPQFQPVKNTSQTPEQENHVQHVKESFGQMSKELKQKLVHKYRSDPIMINRIMSDDPNIDYMHSVSALRKLFEEKPDLFSKEKSEIEKEQLSNMKIGNKQMQRILRQVAGLKGVGDVTQTEKHKEWAFGLSSFARIDEDDSGQPVLSVVDAGKDGNGWDEHIYPLKDIKKFLDEDTQKSFTNDMLIDVLGECYYEVIN